MKFKIDRGELKDALSIVGRAVPRRVAAGNVCTNVFVHLDEEAQRLLLRTTDQEFGLSCQVSAEVEGSGDVLIPWLTLIDLVGVLTDSMLEVDVSEPSPVTGQQMVEVSGGRSTHRIKCTEPVVNFPLFQDLPDDRDVLRFEKTKLDKILRRTLFAQAKDQGRPMLQGLLVATDPDNGLVRFACADGFRLSVQHIMMPTNGAHTWLLYAPPLKWLVRLLSAQPDVTEVFMMWDQRRVQFQVGRMRYYGPLLDVPYPDYEAIIPRKYQMRIAMPREALYDSLVRARVFAREVGGKGVWLQFKKTESDLHIDLVVATPETEVGGTVSTVAIPVSDLDLRQPAMPEKIGVNVTYLLELLAAVEEAEVITFYMTDDARPMLFTLGSVEESNYRHVIMPLVMDREAYGRLARSRQDEEQSPDDTEAEPAPGPDESGGSVSTESVAAAPAEE